MKDPQLQKQLFNKLEGARRSERYFSAYCPFDSHKKPALLVYEDGWHCLSCNTSGSLKYLHNFLSRGTINIHKNTGSLKPILPRWRKWQENYGDVPDIAYAAHRIVKDYDMHGFFKQRKIDQFFEQGLFGRLDGWLTFPVMDKDKEIVDIVVRAGKGKKNCDAKYVITPQNGDASRPLYIPNWERVLSAKTVYVVYGIITAWALEEIELPVITGITGKSLNADLLQDFKQRLVVIPDYDEEEAGARLVNNLGLRGQLKLIDYPDDTTDLDDIRCKYGNETLRQVIGA